MHRAYATRGVALMHKREVPVRQIGSQRAGRFTAVRVARAGVDYVGLLRGGRFVALEVKSSSRAAIPLQRQGKPVLSPGQRAELTRVHALGGIALMLCMTTHGVKRAAVHRWWVLDWQGWCAAEAAAKAAGAASVGVELLRTYGSEAAVDRGAPDWLAALALADSPRTRRMTPT